MNRAELIEILKGTDEVLLLELLEVNSTDLVDAFIDKIIEHEERIRRNLGDN
jgi:hypothetical protein